MDYLNLEHNQQVFNILQQLDNPELEVRIGHFDNGFVSDVGLIAYQRLLDVASHHEATLTQSTDYISSSIRKTVIEGYAPTYIQKTRHLNYDVQSVGARVSVSTETPVDESQYRDVEVVVRHKTRTSFMYGYIRIDVTKVVTESKTSYELEMELTNYQLTSSAIATALNRAFEYVFQVMYDAPIVYTSEEAGDIIEYVNRAMLDYNDMKTRELAPESEVRNKLFYYPYPRPRALEFDDLKVGGIVGDKKGPHIATNEGDIPVTYSVTYKADGEHRLLVFGANGIWLVNPPNTLTLLCRYNPLMLGFVGLILEGELIPVDKRRGTSAAPLVTEKYAFYVFDCLALPAFDPESTQPSIAIQNYHLNARMENAQIMVDYINTEGILGALGISMHLATKSYKAINGVDDFFTVVHKMLENEPLMPYKTDGLIFTHNVGPYNVHAGSLKLEDRVLTKHADIVKWKPPGMLTIDFSVKEVGEQLELYTYHNKKLMRFDRHPTIDRSVAPDAITGNIIELGFIKQEDDSVIPVFHRIRHDKVLPNSSDVATQTFKQILNPITEETLTGRGFKLLRNYHNQVKRQLFNYASSKLGAKINALLDLGSGRGGDISKWRDFERVVAVEPNPEYIEEMKRRLATTYKHMQDRVHIIQAGAQETDKIRKGLQAIGISKVSCISAMLSMTFLWQSKETLNGLCNTISEFLEDGGYFIYMVMDGDTVKQTFQPVNIGMNTSTLVKTSIDYGDARIDWIDGRRVKVHVKDSIVTEQEEYLVFLDDLMLRLQRYGINEGKRYRCDKESMLSIGERMFSRLFTYGSYQKGHMQQTDNYSLGFEAVYTRIPYLDTDRDEAVGDNQTYPVNCYWYPGVMAAVTTIGDGSCFFHAFAKLVNIQYFETNSLRTKLEMVYGLRTQLANMLITVNPQTGRQYYYETQFPALAVADPFYGMQSIYHKIQNPTEYAGDYIYGLIPIFFGINLIVFEYRDNALIPHADTIVDTQLPIVCIIAYDNHYEALIEYDEALQSYRFLFNYTDPFIQAYLREKTRTSN